MSEENIEKPDTKSCQICKQSFTLPGRSFGYGFNCGSCNIIYCVRCSMQGFDRKDRPFDLGHAMPNNKICHNGIVRDASEFDHRYQSPIPYFEYHVQDIRSEQDFIGRRTQDFVREELIMSTFMNALSLDCEENENSSPTARSAKLGGFASISKKTKNPQKISGKCQLCDKTAKRNCNMCESGKFCCRKCMVKKNSFHSKSCERFKEQNQKKESNTEEEKDLATIKQAFEKLPNNICRLTMAYEVAQICTKMFPEHTKVIQKHFEESLRK